MYSMYERVNFNMYIHDTQNLRLGYNYVVEVLNIYAMIAA